MLRPKRGAVPQAATGLSVAKEEADRKGAAQGALHGGFGPRYVARGEGPQTSN